MSPTHPSKRRRIDTASHTLSQPFKSPFKTPLKAKPSTETSLPSSPLKESTLTTKPTPPSPPPPNPALPTTRPHTQSLQPTTSLPHLQKTHTHLLNLLTTARSTLETSTQALAIESSPRKTELEALVQKWKIASRGAAEEVFAKARDRVNKMGGVGAMRERERGGRERGWGWEGEGRKEGDGEGDGDGEDGTGFGGEGRDEREEGVGKEEEGGDEEGYTMDMMLKALGIELDVIGYDKGLQKWVD